MPEVYKAIVTYTLTHTIAQDLYVLHLLSLHWQNTNGIPRDFWSTHNITVCSSTTNTGSLSGDQLNILRKALFLTTGFIAHTLQLILVVLWVIAPTPVISQALSKQLQP